MAGEWHFGHNCRRYLPTLRKCRVLIDRYSQRPELITEKSVTAEELLVYTGASSEELAARVDAGDIRVKRLKTDGSLRFQIRAPWEWDECPLGNCGGQCLDFEPHDGKKISCLMDLERSGFSHPNLADVPSPQEVARLVSRVAGEFDSNSRA